VDDDMASTLLLPDDVDVTEESELYFWVGYLVPLAILRIVLLLLPLLFHSYTGTALRYPRLYQFLYVTSLVVMVLHMLALLLLNPASLESIFPYDGSTNYNTQQHHRQTSTVDQVDERHLPPSQSQSQQLLVNHPPEHRQLLQHLHALRRVWWMLVFPRSAMLVIYCY